MLLNLLYLKVVSFFIDRALNFNLSAKTFNYLKQLHFFKIWYNPITW
jgi:hypothetical protein